jgi:hypothetical protein
VVLFSLYLGVNRFDTVPDLTPFEYTVFVDIEALEHFFCCVRLVKDLHFTESFKHEQRELLEFVELEDSITVIIGCVEHLLDHLSEIIGGDLRGCFPVELLMVQISDER